MPKTLREKRLQGGHVSRKQKPQSGSEEKMTRNIDHHSLRSDNKACLEAIAQAVASTLKLV